MAFYFFRQLFLRLRYQKSISKNADIPTIVDKFVGRRWEWNRLQPVTTGCSRFRTMNFKPAAAGYNRLQPVQVFNKSTYLEPAAAGPEWEKTVSKNVIFIKNVLYTLRSYFIDSTANYN